MTGRLRGKVALVTGAGSGVGQVTAEKFASEGAAVAVLDVHGDSADRTSERIADGGGQALVITADVSVAADVDAALARVGDEFGQLDVLVKNAAIDALGLITTCSEQDRDRCFVVKRQGDLPLARRGAASHHLRQWVDRRPRGRAVRDSASDAASFMTGSVITADGGMSAQ